MIRTMLFFLALPLSPAQEPPPNLLFLLTDDQRADHLGCLHPHLQTPAMDALVRRGVRFENAFVTTSICAASRATLLTGLPERAHRYTFGTPPLAARFLRRSWVKVLRDQGYRTGHVGKFGVRVEKGQRTALFNVLTERRAPYMKKRPDGPRHLTDITADDALAFLDKQPEGKPWALTVSFNAPHAEDPNPDQYIWPQRLNARYADVDVPAPPLAGTDFFSRQPEFIRKSLNRVRWRWRFDSEEKRQRMVKGYWRMITGVDEAVARILAHIQSRGEADRTVVVLTSDNGYFLGDRGFAGKWLPYEASLRVPLVVVDPRADLAQANTVRDQMVLNLDLPSTFLDLCDVDIPSSYQGRSLAPLLRGSRPPWRTAFRFEHRMDHAKIPKLEGIRTRTKKYVRYVGQDPPHEELYDLVADPAETRNLAGKRSSELDRLRALNDDLRETHDEARRDPPRAQASTTRPNVLLIVGDDQHWSDYGFMGSQAVQTPHLDALARRGLLYRHGYVPSSLCCPSLASIVTGLSPHVHGVTGNEPPRTSQKGALKKSDAYRTAVRNMIARLDAHPTLPALLRPRGYWSHQSGKWWLGGYRRGGFTHGMTHGDPSRGGRHGDHGLVIGRQGLAPIERFLDAAEDRPWLLWYAPFLPHRPHNPPERLLAAYRKSSPTLHVARYRAMCTWLDETVGALLSKLDERGLTKNTLVVFLCDNGWIQRPNRAGFAPRSKRSPYEGGLRTPIVLSWPGQISPSVDDTPVLSTDVTTTILRACGVEPPAALRGLDLRKTEQVQARGHVCGAVFQHNEILPGQPSSNLTHRWIIAGRKKLIVPSLGSGTPRRPELYDLLDDAAEQNDLSSAAPDDVQKIRKLLDAWWTPREGGQ